MHFLDDSDAPIRLYTDASHYGIGGVLFQIVDSIWRPIAFVSKSFNATHPNIQVNMEVQPWDTIAQKLPTALKTRYQATARTHVI